MYSTTTTPFDLDVYEIIYYIFLISNCQTASEKSPKGSKSFWRRALVIECWTFS